MTDLLQDATVMVTRPEGQAGRLCQLIEEAGGRALRTPAMAIEPIPLPAHARTAIECSDIVIVVSANAARGLASLRPDREVIPKVLAMGEATKRILKDARWPVSDDTDPQANTEALLESAALSDVDGCAILIAKGMGGRPLLWRALKARGADVEELDLYRRAAPDTLAPAIRHALVHEDVDLMTGTSTELLDNLQRLAGVEDHEVLLETPLVAGGQRVLEHARKLGFHSSHLRAATSPEDGAMFEALSEAWREIRAARGS